MPSDMPRYRMVSPNVSPPNPHMAPKKYVHQSVVALCWLRTPNTSLVINVASTQGQIIQLKKPPTSQYVSHDQRLTPR